MLRLLCQESYLDICHLWDLPLSRLFLGPSQPRRAYLLRPVSRAFHQRCDTNALQLDQPRHLDPPTAPHTESRR